MTSTQLKFKVIHGTDKKRQFRVVSIPEGSPFTAVIKYLAGEFGLRPTRVFMKDGDGLEIESSMSAMEVLLKHGVELELNSF